MPFDSDGNYYPPPDIQDMATDSGMEDWGNGWFRLATWDTPAVAQAVAGSIPVVLEPYGMSIDDIVTAQPMYNPVNPPIPAVFAQANTTLKEVIIEVVLRPDRWERFEEVIKEIEGIE